VEGGGTPFYSLSINSSADGVDLPLNV